MLPAPRIWAGLNAIRDRGTRHHVRQISISDLYKPATPFMAMNSAIALLTLGDVEGLRGLQRWAATHTSPTQVEVVAPLALQTQIWRLGGSDAQREVVEGTRIHALIQASRYDEARDLLDTRLDRRHRRRDELWREDATTHQGLTLAESS